MISNQCAALPLKYLQYCPRWHSCTLQAYKFDVISKGQKQIEENYGQ